MPAVEPGFPSPAEPASRVSHATTVFSGLYHAVHFPRGRDAALYVRQGCLTPLDGMTRFTEDMDAVYGYFWQREIVGSTNE